MRWHALALVAALVMAFLPLVRAEEARIEFDVQAEPRVVTAGEGTVITVTAAAGGEPVIGAHVTLVADGGAFGLAAREAAGATDERGIFRAVWRTGPAEDYPEARFHVVDYTATKDGAPPFTGRLLLRVVPPEASLAPVPTRAHLFVTARATPPFVPVGQTTEVQVVVQRNAAGGEPVAGARVRIDADGGRFLGAGGTSATGETDRAGRLRIQWATAPAETYGRDAIHILTVTVTKNGIEEGRAQLEVGVVGRGQVPGADPDRLRAMFVTASADPAVVQAGGETLLTVVARADGPGGVPLPGAGVEVLTEQGQFGDQPGGRATGFTDRAGAFQVTWRPVGRAGAQEAGDQLFSVHVRAPGFKEGRTRAHARLEAAPAPPPPAGHLLVEAQATPAAVRAGDDTTIAVRVRTRDRTPVANAQVTVTAGGGSFDGTSRTTATGFTRSDGSFSTVWHSGAASLYPSDMGFTFYVTALARGVGEGEGQLAVQVLAGQPADTPPVLEPDEEAPRGSLLVVAEARPASIRAGGATTIVVSVRTADKRPVPGANVLIAAGGGSFGNGREARANGTTGRDGTWRIAWHTGPAGAYAGETDYKIAVAAWREGVGSARTSVPVRVAPLAVVAPPPVMTPATLSVAVATRARSIPAGSNVQVAVRVQDDAGRPVAGAAVDVLASTGTFDGGTGAGAVGTTDAGGYLYLTWHSGAASQYAKVTTIQFGATVRKPGHAEATAKTTLVVTPIAIK